MKPKFERYHIEAAESPPKIKLPSKFVVKRYSNCVNIQECTQACIYEAHVTAKNGDITDPINDLCRGCHLCVLTCPKAALTLGINPQFLKLGNSYFTPDRIKTIYFEAETGRVPVSGTGYKGPFAGTGFDGIWFDFSEIVRPTRDGIHGREYISTAVDLGRKPPHLHFDRNGNLVSNLPRNIEIPVPIIIDAPALSPTKKNMQLAAAKAAAKLGTFSIVNSKDYSNDLAMFQANTIPRVSPHSIDEFEDLIKRSRIVEVEATPNEAKECIKRLRQRNPTALVSMHLPYTERSGEGAEALAKAGADIIHFYMDDKTVEQDPDLITDAIRAVHLHLVDKGIRDEITFVSSGGIAEAAHVPKSIILGADAVSIGLAYQIALGCKVCYGPQHSLTCPIQVEDQDIESASQRIINLVGSWRDQLLEVLGGMGLREVRRQRGDTGRALFYKELEIKIFGDEE